MSENKRYVCVHGHFYQPPRENPWLGVIEPQAGAEPFPNWNERIFSECYAAGARARIHDQNRAIDRLANNFLNMSFNIGPTLFSWLAKHHPGTTKRIVAADQKSCERLEGHGNAVSQVYNHMIMPLAQERDKHTQILWGIADFVHRFGRQPEGMWLSECAVDYKTVRALIDHGIRYIILAPKQASRVRHLNSHHWQECVSVPLDTRMPYRIFERDSHHRKLYNRHLDVFFYDGAISNAIAFEKLLRNADKMGAKFEELFDSHPDKPQLVSAATDGESYGHHEPYGEMCLAFFFEDFVIKHQDIVTNYSYFLAKFPPEWEVELWEGSKGEGSSWSCSHGVDRWYRHCGCSDGGEDWYRQDWRTPLREAFDDIRSAVDMIFEKEGSLYLVDPWDARNDYISVILEPSPESRQRFLQKHTNDSLAETEIDKLWCLLEMQHNAMLMYTSCGWFFADLGGVEPVQNMRYALRMLEYARNFTDEDLKARLISHLEKARSNVPALGSGGDLFRARVETCRYTPEVIAACYAIMEMYELARPPFQYNLSFEDTDRSPVAGVQAFRGSLVLEDQRTFIKTCYAFVAAHISDRETACAVQACASAAEAKAFLKPWSKLSLAELTQRLSKEGYLIRDMPQSQRLELLTYVLNERLEEVNAAFSQTYDNLRPLLTILSENKIKPPQVMEVAAQSVLSQRFLDVCERLAQKGSWDKELTDKAREILAEAAAYALHVNLTLAAPVVAEMVLDYMLRITASPLVANIQEVTKLIEFSREVGFFFENGGKIENNYWYLLRKDIIPLLQQMRAGKLSDKKAKEAESLIGAVKNLGAALKFSESHLENLLAFVEIAEPDEGEP
ncbi:MAG: DUF3536 domain-containing protein [Planctomycetes bacterium]|nr:DUF3536 domain-containing protein [Planctomycetota bacterium]